MNIFLRGIFNIKKYCLNSGPLVHKPRSRIKKFALSKKDSPQWQINSCSQKQR